ncbi:Hypothetical predicted protein [Paramuricea clavata]|uniref:Uncharacterized protein n=1 Tax=Paramuricea clavata TaxID=317549 RepID=A0A7D9I8U6_PARCT|nr:Hypothetical predicted protein [Paramuricea clavata]
MEYACQVFHNNLPAYLSNEIERIQKRAMHVIFPDLSYNDALAETKLSKLERHEGCNDEYLIDYHQTERKITFIIVPRKGSSRRREAAKCVGIAKKILQTPIKPFVPADNSDLVEGHAPSPSPHADDLPINCHLKIVHKCGWDEGMVFVRNFFAFF